jgi:hypothetical protein
MSFGEGDQRATFGRLTGPSFRGVPDDIRFYEVVPQDLLLGFDAIGQEGVAVDEMGDRSARARLRGVEERHGTTNVHLVYMK